jgi:hypothetical protein
MLSFLIIALTFQTRNIEPGGSRAAPDDKPDVSVGYRRSGVRRILDHHGAMDAQIVPEQMAAMGFGGLNFAAFLRPPLTTARGRARRRVARCQMTPAFGRKVAASL